MVGHHIQRQCPRTVGFGFDQRDSAGRTSSNKRDDGGSRLLVVDGHRRRFQYILAASEGSLDFPQFNPEPAAFHLPIEASEEKIVAVSRLRHTVPSAVIAFAIQTDE